MKPLPAAPDIRLAALQGPLMELSLATEAPHQHVKSWWQAWTLQVFSTRVRPVASSPYTHRLEGFEPWQLTLMM